MAQYLRPNGDSNTRWSCSTGTLRYALVNSVSVNDATYIYNPDTSYIQSLDLTNPSVPTTTAGHSFKFRAKGSYTNTPLRIYLYQGPIGSSISIYDKDNIYLSTSYSLYTVSIPTANVANITDYSALRIGLYAKSGTIYVSQLYLEIPNGLIKPGLEMGCSF